MRIENDYRPEVRSLLNRLCAYDANFELLGVDDGGDVIRTSNRPALVEAIAAVDESRLIVREMPMGRTRTLVLVLGNEPGVIVCDHSDTPGLTAVVDAHADAWSGRPQPTRAVED